MTKETIPAEKVIRELGGPAKIAKLCDITRSAVCQWKKNGIPKGQLNFLRLARPDVFDAYPAAPKKPSRRKTDLQPQ